MITKKKDNSITHAPSLSYTDISSTIKMGGGGGGDTKVLYEELSDVHGIPGLEACSLRKCFTFARSKIKSGAFWQHNCSNSTYFYLCTQQYWI